MQGESLALGDILAIGTGAIGIAAGKMQNKALLIAYMVLAIITALWFGAGILPFSVLTSLCGTVNDLVDATCTNDAGEPYCCYACTESTCPTTGCMWVPEYTTGSCQADEGVTLPTPCDKQCCETTLGASWSPTVMQAACQQGSPGQMVGSGHGEGTCELTNDVVTKDQCSVMFGTYSNENILSTGGPASYSNAGCHKDTEGGGADSGLCDYTTFIWLTIFITLATAIAGSVMGCCVVCCGNDQLGEGDSDSG